MNFDVHTHTLRRNALVDLDPVDIIHPDRSSDLPPTFPVISPATSGLPDSTSFPGYSLSVVGWSPLLRPGYLYSVGIHPWNIFRVTPSAIRLLRALAAEPQIRAIGECGLDPRHFTSSPAASVRSDTLDTTFSREFIIERQIPLLRLHYELSEELRKPLILHIVKTFPEIIRLKDSWCPAQPWIIHGFRGKPQLARELLAHGFHLSYGLRYNPASLAVTPSSRLLRETD